MASHTKSQPNSGIDRRWFLAGAAGGAMLPVAARAAPPKPKKRGVWQNSRGTPADDDNLVDKVTDFSYQNDVLAQLIVEMWTTSTYADLLAAPDVTDYGPRSTNAQTALAARGIYLAKPIVITEKEYEDGFSLADAGLSVTNGVVFVLPRYTRATAGKPLLETAKMLMAITPNGI